MKDKLLVEAGAADFSVFSSFYDAEAGGVYDTSAYMPGEYCASYDEKKCPTTTKQNTPTTLSVDVKPTPRFVSICAVQNTNDYKGKVTVPYVSKAQYETYCHQADIALRNITAVVDRTLKDSKLNVNSRKYAARTALPMYVSQLLSICSILGTVRPQ